MLFHAPLISFVTAIVLASGMTASATSVRRDDGTGHTSCCVYTSIITHLGNNIESLVLGSVSGLDLRLPVGVNCDPEGSQQWYCAPDFSILSDGLMHCSQGTICHSTFGILNVGEFEGECFLLYGHESLLTS